MKLRKNVNYHTIIAKLDDLNGHSNALKADFQRLVQVFDDNKLGITELDYKLEEELNRFKGAYAKIEELLRSI